MNLCGHSHTHHMSMDQCGHLYTHHVSLDLCVHGPVWTHGHNYMPMDQCRIQWISAVDPSTSVDTGPVLTNIHKLCVPGPVHPWTSVDTCTLFMCPWTSVTLDQCGHSYSHHVSMDQCGHLYTCHMSMNPCNHGPLWTLVHPLCVPGPV